MNRFWTIVKVVLISVLVSSAIFMVAFFAGFGAMAYYQLGQLGAF